MNVPRRVERTFQNIRLLLMSVLENVAVGAERPGNTWPEPAPPRCSRCAGGTGFRGLRRTRKRPVGSCPTATSA